MSVFGPSREFDIELMVEFLEDLFTDYGPIVVAPARNLWIEQSNEVFLRGRLVAAYALGQRFVMTLDGVGTRCDEGLEASSRCRIELAHSILTNRETQEVEARLSLLCRACVGRRVFLGCQFKARCLGATLP